MNDDRVHEVYYGEAGDEATRVLTRARIRWIVDRVPLGRIIDVGCSQGLVPVLLAERGADVVGVDSEAAALEFALATRKRLPAEVQARLEYVEADGSELPFEGASFEHAVCSEVLEHVEEPGAVLEEIFRVLAPGGTLVVTVPLGVLPHPDHKRVFYPEALSALLDPLFECEPVELLERHLAIVARRRKRAKGKPAYVLSSVEAAFLDRELELRAAEGRTRTILEEANAKYREVTGSLASAQSDRDQLEATVSELRGTGRVDREQLRERRRRRREQAAARWRRLEKLERDQARSIETVEAAAVEVEEELERGLAAVDRGQHVGVQPVRPAHRRGAPGVDDDFEHWRERAAAAPGDEVIFMYSGTIYVQEKRGNRPIRLTRVYLEQERPVFFNYWRWRNDDSKPEWGHPLLHQSPVDVTPTVLDRLLEADFGDKRKLLFASLPHELMIRGLSRAVENGWVTIYDARDDWEEFEKVGMAKWYDPGFEEYLVRHADVVTAVSEPLGRKLAVMGEREDIEIVANALDSNFPLPPGRREPTDPPTVGYFGHLTPKWFDWDLVIRSARQHPDWRFELAGHQHPEDLSLPDNVKLLGLLGHEELAALSRRWSFAIIPFKMTPLGEAVDPIKVYEYLHLGLPVLSSYMPQMRDYPGTTVAESADEFLALLPSMPEHELDSTAVRLWLERNTWEVRIDDYSRLAAEAATVHGEGHDLRSLLAYPYEHGRRRSEPAGVGQDR
jgi:SAM-dependent methyltransferase/glycosyltransferase involved in cell wall biosynthesis